MIVGVATHIRVELVRQLSNGFGLGRGVSSRVVTEFNLTQRGTRTCVGLDVRVDDL